MFSKEKVHTRVQSMLPEPVEIAETDNLIEFGLDSLKIMRLASEWRRAGARVTFAELIEKPNLRDWWTMLRQAAVASTPAVERAVQAGLKPGPFALTDVQHAYWIGRRDGQTLGGVGCHAYLEMDGREVDPERLEKAWKALFRHHPMLRARFLEDGTQEILDTSSYDGLTVHDLRRSDPADVARHLGDMRQILSHRRLHVERGESVGLALSLLPNGAARIHFDVDLLVADVQSLHILLRDLAAGYARGVAPAAPVDWDFSQYLAKTAAERSEGREQAAEYWKGRLADMPGAPGLPLRVKPESLGVPVYRRRERTLEPRVWKAIRSRAGEHKTTPAMVLLTMYASVLARWSEHPRFLINIPLFDRLDDMPGIEDVVADFSSLLLLEVDYSTDRSFLGHLNDIKIQFQKDVRHSSYSGVQVQRDMARLRQGGGVAAPVVFACNLGTPLLTDEFRTHLGEFAFMVSQTPQVWLDFQVYETGDTLMVAWDATEGLFPDGMIDEMFSAYVELAEWLARDGNDWTGVPELLPAEQLSRREKDLNIAMPAGPLCLHMPFFSRASEIPDQVALIDGRDASAFMRYGELAREALRVAAYLKENGVESNEPVAVILPRGKEQVIAVLGVLAAGAFYVPVGVEQPHPRRDGILRKAGVRCVLTTAALREAKWPDGVKALDIAAANDASPLVAPQAGSPAETAYVIFTSGSTGEPKGVDVGHAAAWNTIAAINTLYGIGANDRALAVSALDFDLSVYDIFGLLSVGGSIVLLDDASRRDADKWLSLVHAHRVGIWNSVPTLLDMLLTAAEGQDRHVLPLRQVMLSGDWIGLELPARLEAVAPGCGLVAMGGATEAAIWSNYQDVTLPLPEHWVSIPYGRPLPGQMYRVVDAAGRDCPDWVPGELWIGGAGVASGYKGDPELSAERFPESGGLRWYRTGDQGRFWPDGTIEFLGRRDFQVKIRGHRIETGEIESVLMRHPGVHRAVVTVQEGAKGAKRLVAHVVPAVSPDRAAPSGGLRAELAARVDKMLPDYMAPQVWNILPALPLTANGKVDRNALADTVKIEVEPEERFVAPRTETEQCLAGIWRGILQVASVGLHDSFFELGGDSLVGTRLVAEIRRVMGARLPLEKLFSSPTVAALAAYIDAEAEPIPSASELAHGSLRLRPDVAGRHEPFPLNEIQNAYWVGRRRELELGNVATIFYYELDNPHLDVPRLNRAWNKVIARHPMLRAVVQADGHQRVMEAVPEYSFPVTDFSGLSSEERESTLASVRREMTSRVMPGDVWPLFDIRASLSAGGGTRLHVSFDCLMVDAWSLLILTRDWHRFYMDESATPPPIEATFRDYVLAERELATTEQYAADREYWFSRLDSLPAAPDLPLAKEPAAVVTPVFRRRSHRLGKKEWSTLKDRAGRNGLTPSNVPMAVYAEVLKQWSRSRELTINLTLFNRLPLHEEVNGIVGDFTSLTLLAVDNDGEESFLGRALLLQRQLLRDLEHRSYNGVSLLREIARRRGSFNRSAMPVVFTSALNMGSLGSDSGFGLLGDMVYSVSQTPQVWLDCQVYESDGEAILTWDAVEELFPQGMLDDMFKAFCALVDGLVADEGHWARPLLSLVPKTQLERRAAVNSTEAPLTDDLLHTLALRGAKTHLDSPAVITPAKRLSHGELTAYAAGIGRLLRKKGAVPNDLVAVVMEKGWEQVAAVLGIQASGAAYLPIDPELPAKRVAHLMADAGVRLVLTQSTLAQRLPWPDGLELLAVDTLEPGDGPMPEPAQSPEDLAYVIYTSGSTGRPKGVMVDHRGAVNTILDINSRFNVGSDDRALALSNLNFDLSVYDVFGTLAAGGAIVLPQADRARDPAHWWELIRAEHVSIWNSVPMMMQMLIDSSAEPVAGALGSLRVALLSGDWIPLDLPGAIRALNADTRVAALGGATEASIWSNVFEVESVPPHWRSIPYGKPMRNQRYHVLDDAFRDMPDWVPGNLFIAGDGLALGYRGDAEKTNAAFVTHPQTGERLYRTGDMGRYLPDGNIEFLGRQDTQVKIGGHRIELGEIEAVLERRQGVRRAVALTEGPPLTLAAVVVLQYSPNDAGETEKELALHLGEYLPGYMVPRKIMVMEELPLSDNGKVDLKAIRAALGEHGGFQRHSNGREAPLDGLERQLAEVWMEQLGLRDISRHDDFFSLGGDSLKAARIIRRLHTAKIVPGDVSLRTFFIAPTIAEFSRHVPAREQSTTPGHNSQHSFFEESFL